MVRDVPDALVVVSEPCPFDGTRADRAGFERFIR